MSTGVAGRALGSAGGSYGPFRIHILGSLALAEAWQGRLLRAAELADEALELSREPRSDGSSRTAMRISRERSSRSQRGEPETAAFALA